MPRQLNSFRCFFVNNCLMDAFSGLMGWFAELYFTEFKTVVLGGYHRAILEIQNNLAQNREAEKPRLPAISLNPFGDMSTDTKFPQLWRLPSIGEKLEDLYMEPHYEDEYFGFSILANRFTGNFEVILFLQSPYEYLDHYIQSLMFFHGGFNRRIRPGLIQTHCLIPDIVIETAYQDAPYDWTNSGVTSEFNKVLNRDHFIFPMEIGPQIWLTAISNASTIYGEDGLSTYKLQITCEYDIDLPTHIIVKNIDYITSLNLKFSTGDPIFIPSVARFRTDDETIVFKTKDMHQAGLYNRPSSGILPINILNTGTGDSVPRSYFRSVKMQEYQPYIFGSKSYARACTDGLALVHHATLHYHFDADVLSTDNFQVDISSAKVKVNHYDKILIGFRYKNDSIQEQGILIYGTSFVVDLEQTGQIITVKMDVRKNTIWDILIYKDASLKNS